MSTSVKKRTSEYTSIINEDFQNKGGSLKLKLVKKPRLDAPQQIDDKSVLYKSQDISKESLLQEKLGLVEKFDLLSDRLDTDEHIILKIIENIEKLLKLDKDEDIMSQENNYESNQSTFYTKLYMALETLNTIIKEAHSQKTSTSLKPISETIQPELFCSLTSSLINQCYDILCKIITIIPKSNQPGALNVKTEKQGNSLSLFIQCIHEVFKFVEKSLSRWKGLINESSSTTLMSALINMGYLILHLQSHRLFPYLKPFSLNSTNQTSNMISENFIYPSGGLNPIHRTRVYTEILFLILKMSCKILPFSDLVTKFSDKAQNVLIILATDQEPRIRTMALQNLLKLHQAMDLKLLPQIFDLVTLALNDDMESIRETSIILLHQVAITYPETQTLSATGTEDIYAIRNSALTFLQQSAVGEGNCSPKTTTSSNPGRGSNRITDPGKILSKSSGSGVADQRIPLMDDAFYKLCRVMVNDISANVRAQAVRLLAFPYAPSSMSLYSYEGSQPDDPSGPTPSRSTLWPLLEGSVLLEQTLDKQTLMSNMRRKRTYHERALAGYLTGQGASVTKDDRPLDSLLSSHKGSASTPNNISKEGGPAKATACPEISAEAGAFVHGLEDECSLVRSLTIDSMAELARKSRLSASAVESPKDSQRRQQPGTPAKMAANKSRVEADRDFGAKAVDFLVDMFNDEIVDVRLRAIRALAKIGGGGGSSNTRISFQTDQVEIILGALEDSSQDIREALRSMLSQCQVNDVASVALLVRHLLLNLNKYPQDFHSVCECIRDFGIHHSSLIRPLIPDLLCTTNYDTLLESCGSNPGCYGLSGCWDFEFDPVEPDVTEDRAYVCVLTLVLNALFFEGGPLAAPIGGGDDHLGLLPAFVMDRHYPYLRDTYPSFFKKASHRPDGDESQLSGVDQVPFSEAPLALLCRLRDSLLTGPHSSGIGTGPTRPEFIIRSNRTIIRDCERLGRLLSHDLDDTSTPAPFIGDVAGLVATVLEVRNGLLPYVVVPYRNAGGTTPVPTPQVLRKIKLLLFRLTYRYWGLSPELLNHLKILKFYLLALYARTLSPSSEAQKRTLAIFRDIVKEVNIGPSARVIPENFFSDPDTLNDYLVSTSGLGHCLEPYVVGPGTYDSRNRQLGTLRVTILDPPPKPACDVPRKFLAGLTLAISTEISIATCPPDDVRAWPQQRGIEGGTNLLQSSEIVRNLQLRVAYPDDRVDYIHIPASDYKHISGTRCRVETNIYLASQKSWTEPSHVELTVVLNIDSSPEDVRIVNEIGIDDWMEPLPLTPPTQIFVQPKVMGTK